ncbi:MAG: hypothetical protein M3Z23_19415 [Acidobacteriota bacterium]|nr:hypothetical protein [Acidobacteriota bacterium]
MDALAFLDRFEIISEVTSYCRRARDRETEATVLVHALPALVNWERSLDEASVIAQGEQEGTLYVVTDDLPRLIDLRARVEIQASGKHDPGEFTQMFRVPLELTAKETPLQKPVASSEPGEFTRIFQAPSQMEDAAPDPPKPAALPGPGEFTQLFAKPTPALDLQERQPPAPNAPIPGGPDLDSVTQDFGMPEPGLGAAGEGTRLFEVPPQAPPLPSVPAQAAETPKPEVRLDGGEFTKLFKVPESTPAEFDNYYASPYAGESRSMQAALDSQTPSLAPERPLTRDPGSFTRLFGGPEPVSPDFQESNAPGATSVFAVPESAASSPGFSPPAQGPSEYTRLFQRPANTPSPKPLSTGGPEPEAANKTQPPPLVMIALIVGGLLLIAILVVVFFAIRR